MRILIATTHVPFVRGGAEVLSDGLRDALIADGHEVDIAAVPFTDYPPARILERVLACRLLDLTSCMGTAVDRVIGLKFPAYLIPHPNKVLWILHQHRSAYDLQHTPYGLVNLPRGAELSEAVRAVDREFIPEARATFTISRNVSNRLKRYCGLDSTPLYPPVPDAERFYSAPADDYLFFPSRMGALKRHALVLEALAKTRHPVRVRFAGVPEHPSLEQSLRETTRALGLGGRVEWLGRVTDDDKRRLFAHALGVVFPPADEDYGYVTLEAMLASKPVITCSDSGGPIEFVVAGETGSVVEPRADALASAMDALWLDRDRARRLGEAGRERYNRLGITWAKVVEALLSPP